MKLLVLALLLLNLALWYGLSRFPTSSTASSVATGTLPRVEGLKATALAPSASLGASKVGNCVTVGWFETAGDAETLAKKGRPLEATSYQITKENHQMPPLYWVIIPPQPEQIALAQLKELQKQGVESYLVTEGENRNAISLGLYESREAAVSVLEEKNTRISIQYWPTSPEIR